MRTPESGPASGGLTRDLRPGDFGPLDGGTFTSLSIWKSRAPPSSTRRTSLSLDGLGGGDFGPDFGPDLGPDFGPDVGPGFGPPLPGPEPLRFSSPGDSSSPPG